MEQSVIQLENLLLNWKKEYYTSSYEPILMLNELCDLFSNNLKNCLKKDSIAFDDHYQCQKDSNCNFCHLYEILFRESNFITKLVNYYLIGIDWPRLTNYKFDLNVATCRFVIHLLLGLKTINTFTISAEKKFIKKLISWAENDTEPLQTCAIGLLSLKKTMKAAKFKKYNIRLAPIILNRLHNYCTLFCEENENNLSSRPILYTINDQTKNEDTTVNLSLSKKKHNICDYKSSSWVTSEISDWIQPTLSTKLIFCLKYLVLTGKIKEFIHIAYEKNSISLLIKLINSPEKQNGRLTFEALKYLGALLRHSKIAIKFIDLQGLQKLLLIPIHSIPVSGVSICFHSLSCCKEAMERISLLSELKLMDLIKYAICLLEISPDSSRLHVIKFFNNSLHFKIILELFDKQDGLRKMINMVSTYPIISSRNPENKLLTQDFLTNQVICNFCASLKHYFETHLHIKAQQIRETIMSDNGPSNFEIMVHNFFSVPGFEFNNKSQVDKEINFLSTVMSKKSRWTPVDLFIKVGGFNLLLWIISQGHKWKFTEKREMIRNALDVLNICAVLPKVRLLLCDKLSEIQTNEISLIKEYPYTESHHVGLNIIIKLLENSLNTDILKTSLSIIVTCICAPIIREEEGIPNNLTNEMIYKLTNTTNHDIDIEKIINCINSYNGIKILIKLITTEKSDAVRRLASQALAGLARSKLIWTILSQLPLLNRSQLQNHITVLVVKHQNHVTFQKYTPDLLASVFGRRINNDTEIETSLATINQNQSVGVKISPIILEQAIQNPTFELADSSNDLSISGFNVQSLSSSPISLNITRKSMNTNFVLRCPKNIHSRKQDQKLIHGRFLPTNVFHIEDEVFFTDCKFLKQNKIALSTNTGKIVVFNTFNGEKELTFGAHKFDIKNLEYSNEEKLLVSVPFFGPATIWAISDESFITHQYSLNLDYCTFINYRKTELLGTENKLVTIYDVETSNKILTLVPKCSNHYWRNRAAFNSTDKSVLSDGILWDTKTGKEIHKFDKLNEYFSGVFHPNGREIITGTKVWDVRTYQLLHTVSSLNNCDILFTKTGDGMYSFVFDYKNVPISDQKSFKTLNPHDYSNIATINVQKYVCQMTCSNFGTQIAVIESEKRYFRGSPSLVRIYDINKS